MITEPDRMFFQRLKAQAELKAAWAEAKLLGLSFPRQILRRSGEWMDQLDDLHWIDGYDYRRKPEPTLAERNEAVKVQWEAMEKTDTPGIRVENGTRFTWEFRAPHWPDWKRETLVSAKDRIPAVVNLELRIVALPEPCAERDSLTNERDILQRMLAAAEEQRDVYGLDIKRLYEANGELGWNMERYARERDTLAQRVAELEERNGVQAGLIEECRNFESIRNGDLVAERDKLRGYYDEIVRELGDDLALKRIRDLAARCEKLGKALAEIRDDRAVGCANEYEFTTRLQETANNALNQSPE